MDILCYFPLVRIRICVMLKIKLVYPLRSGAYVLLVSKGPKTRGLRFPRTPETPSPGRESFGRCFLFLSGFCFCKFFVFEPPAPRKTLFLVAWNRSPAEENDTRDFSVVGKKFTKTQVQCLWLVRYKLTFETNYGFWSDEADWQNRVHTSFLCRWTRFRNVW